MLLCVTPLCEGCYNEHHSKCEEIDEDWDVDKDLDEYWDED